MDIKDRLAELQAKAAERRMRYPANPTAEDVMEENQNVEEIMPYVYSMI